MKVIAYHEIGRSGQQRCVVRRYILLQVNGALGQLNDGQGMVQACKGIGTRKGHQLYVLLAQQFLYYG